MKVSIHNRKGSIPISFKRSTSHSAPTRAVLENSQTNTSGSGVEFIKDTLLKNIAHFLGLQDKYETISSNCFIVEGIDSHRHCRGIDATHQRVMALDAYSEDRSVEKDPAAERLLHDSEHGLNSNGIFLSILGDLSSGKLRDIGYFLSYRVSVELKDGQLREDLPQLFIDAHQRADWLQIQEYLTSILPNQSELLSIDKIHHWYDYAVPLHEDRSFGYGRISLFLGLEKTLSAGEVAVGFIDNTNLDHVPSIIAALSVPNVFLGPERLTSPDGEHRSLLVCYAKDCTLHFNNEIVATKEEAKKDIMAFVVRIREALARAANAKKVLGFNPETNCYELASCASAS